MTKRHENFASGQRINKHGMHGSRKPCQRGSIFSPKFDSFLSEPSSARQQNSIFNEVLLACRWWPNIECWLGSFVVFQGILTSITKKPYIFVIFQEESGPPVPPPPSGSPHALLLLFSDMQSPDRHGHAYSCYHVTMRRSAALLQWFDNVSTVKSKIIVRILYLWIALKDIFVTLKFATLAWFTYIS